MSRTVTVAATQMACSWDREANIANAEKLEQAIWVAATVTVPDMTASRLENFRMGVILGDVVRE